MTFLLDTHVLLWWWSEPERLSDRVIALLRDPGTRVVVSAASAWEIATRHRIGKFPDGGRIVEQWRERIDADGFVELPITPRHALRAGAIAAAQRDPFDRMLAAQSILEPMPIASNDTALSALGAERLWE